MTLLVDKERKKCVRRAIISGLISQITKSCKLLVAASSFGYVTDDRTNGFSERARCEASRVASLHSIEKPKIDPIGRSAQPVDPLYMVHSSRYHLQVSPQCIQKSATNLLRIHRSHHRRQSICLLHSESRHLKCGWVSTQPF